MKVTNKTEPTKTNLEIKAETIKALLDTSIENLLMPASTEETTQ